jgi:hypothetical protein
MEWLLCIRIEFRSQYKTFQNACPLRVFGVGPSEVGLPIAEEQAVCSGRLKRKRDTLLPLLKHAIAPLHEFRVRFHVGLQIL